MIFKIHYFCLSAGSNAFTVLLGVFIETYTDASPMEIGSLYMILPLSNIFFRPIICAMADRNHAHKRYTIICQLVVMFGYMPFIIIPYMGPTLYGQHSRLCWYLFCGFKVAADIAVGGLVSIADSLAINYAKRIDTEFTVYRVWGAIAWMSFGIITGNINELPFFPRYVPGFLVLMTACMVDITALWLWPDDYFKMISATDIEAEQAKRRAELGVTDDDANKSSFFGNQSKSLMPRQQVWAHSKGKLKGIFKFSCTKSQSESTQKRTNNNNTIESGLWMQTSKTKPTEQDVKLSDDKPVIDKRTQLRILLTLLRRDLRIPLYCLFFICTGIILAAYSFFYISLAIVCNESGACNFSRLAGFLQVSVAGVEALAFLVIKRVLNVAGPICSCALCFMFMSVKWTFYGLFWYSMDPHYSLILEMLQGCIFALNLTLMVEMGHSFSTRVEHILPELVERKLVSSDQLEAVKLSLSATMQALTSCSSDGIGRCIGCIIYGLLFTYFSPNYVWLTVAVTTGFGTVILVIIKLIDSLCHIKTGLDSEIFEEEIIREQRYLKPKMSIGHHSVHSYS